MDKLINGLKSSDPLIRYDACHQLIDLISESKKILISQIFNPENKNHNGLMVHTLSFLYCEDIVSELLQVLTTAGFEPANIAYNTLCQQIYEITDSDVTKIEDSLNTYFSSSDESDFPLERIGMIREVLKFHFDDGEYRDRILKYIEKCDVTLQNAGY